MVDKPNIHQILSNLNNEQSGNNYKRKERNPLNGWDKDKLYLGRIVRLDKGRIIVN